MKTFIRVMKALTEPSRVKIVKMLAEKEMCVCEIQTALGLAQPTVSKHLQVLEEAGLVGRRKEGLWVNFRLAAESDYAGEVLQLLRGWLNEDPAIRELLERLPGLDRVEICGTGRLPAAVRRSNSELRNGG